MQKELFLEEVESKMVVEACDIDLESKAESGYRASGYPPHSHQAPRSEMCWKNKYHYQLFHYFFISVRIFFDIP